MHAESARQRCLGILVAVTLAAPGLAGCGPNSGGICGQPTVMGYRGAHRVAPENTIAGIDLAVAAGVDGVEIDVQRTADGVLIAFHDDTTGRTTDDPRDRDIAAVAYAELATLDAGSWFAPSFAGERIPTLADAVARVPDDLPIVFDLKSDTAVDPLIAFIRDQELEDRALFSSFSWQRLAILHEALPDVPIGYCLAQMSDLIHAEDAGATYVRLPGFDERLGTAWDEIEAGGFGPVATEFAIEHFARASMIMAGDPELALETRSALSGDCER